MYCMYYILRSRTRVPIPGQASRQTIPNMVRYKKSRQTGRCNWTEEKNEATISEKSKALSS